MKRAILAPGNAADAEQEFTDECQVSCPGDAWTSSDSRPANK
jgi:hypothetical protein